MNLTTALPYLNPLYTHEPVSFALSQFLKKQGIKLDRDRLQQKLSEHPYYSSLLSISDILNDLGIAHQVYQTDINTLISDFSKPLFTHLTIQGQELFAIIEQFENDKFKIITEKAETHWYSHKELETVWGGILLELESGESVIMPKQNETYPKALKYGIYVSIFSALACFIYLKTAGFSFQQVLLFIFNCVGIAISWILVLQHLNKNNALVKQLCQSKTQEGCSSVLSSKASQITPWLSMAEAGLIYFIGAALTMLFFSKPIFYLYLALLAPLYSLYAIYIQAFVLKEWCRLCMGIHVLVLASFISVLVFYGSLFSTIQLPELAQFAVFLIPLVIWLTANPIIKKLKDAEHSKIKYSRLKSNPELFKILATKQSKIDIPTELKVFQFGNLEAIHELTFISNPFCGPCAKAHQIIDEWLQNNNLDFKISIIFSHTNHEEDRNKQFVEWISGIRNKEELISALHNWFNLDNKDITKWAERLHLTKAVLKYDAEHLDQWMNMTDINATPTFFINGYRLPNEYRLEDIKYLILEIN